MTEKDDMETCVACGIKETDCHPPKLMPTGGNKKICGTCATIPACLFVGNYPNDHGSLSLKATVCRTYGLVCKES